jgi:hypothetical protein
MRQFLCLLLVLSGPVALGQARFGGDSARAQQLLGRAFLRDDAWLNATDEAGVCLFPKKGQARAAVAHVHLLPVQHLDYQRFQAYRLGQDAGPSFARDTIYRLGLLRKDGQWVSALHLVPLQGPGQPPVLFVDNAEFRAALSQLPPDTWGFFFDSFFCTYGCLHRNQVYLLDRQVNRFRPFDEFAGGIDGVERIKAFIHKL